MKKSVPNIRRAGKPDEEKLRLAEDIKSLLPHMTDEIHMKVALALHCDYKVIKGYLAGNIANTNVARELVRLLRAIIDRQYYSPANVSADEAAMKFYDMAEAMINIFRICKSNRAMLEHFVKIFNDKLQQVQVSLDELKHAPGSRLPGTR